MKYLLASLLSFALALTTALTAVAEGELMLVDSHGKPILSGKFKTLKPLAVGLYLASPGEHSKKLLLDQSGQEVKCPVPTGCELAGVFMPADFKSYTGVLPKGTILEVSNRGLYGLVDLKGIFVVPLEYEFCQALDFGLLRFDRQNPSTGKKVARIFDMRTRHLSSNELEIEGFADVHPGGEDMLMVAGHPTRNGDGGFNPVKYGFCDRDLNLVLPTIFESCTLFVNGLSVVRTADSEVSKSKDSRRVFIDKRGHFVAKNIVPQGPFNSQGFAIASSEGSSTGLGLVNRKFEFVIEPGYQTLTQVAPHIYAAKKAGAAQQIAIDDRGKELYRFPQGIVDFTSFNDGVSDPDFIIASMTDPEFKPSEGYKGHDCLFDTAGNVLIPPKYYLSEAKFGLIQATVGEGDQMLSGVLDVQGQVKVPFQVSYLEIVGPNEIIKTIRNEGFDSATWKSGQRLPTSRAEQFAKFLKQYDLIGMSLDRCRELLGTGSEIPTSSPDVYRCRYSLVHHPDAELEFEHRILKRWRLNGGRSCEPQETNPPWLTENMVFETTPNIMNAKLIKKTAQ